MYYRSRGPFPRSIVKEILKLDLASAGVECVVLDPMHRSSDEAAVRNTEQG